MMHQETGEEQYLEHAFYFSERNKATLLYQSLQDAGAKLAAGLPDSLLERERNLKVDIAFYQNKIFEAEQQASTEDSAKLSSWRQILFDKEEAYRMLVKQLETDYPAYHGLKYNQAILSTQQIQERLEEDQLLIEFFEGDSSVYVFAIGKDKIAVYEHKRTEQYDEQLQALLASLHQPQQGLVGLKAFANPAHALFRQLVAPTWADKDYRQLIIVPDGQLAYLPFELLLKESAGWEGLDDRQAGRAYRNLTYLFQSQTIRYAYSGSLLFSSLYKSTGAKHTLAAFAPAYEGNWFLASNQSQAEAAAQIVGGDAFTGPQASKQNFMTLAPDYRMLHLAMHAEPDEYSPLRARLIFAGDDTAQSTSLYAHELYNLKLKAQLAVLAACESGHGKLEKSEGVYSLARAFRYAGCPAVVSSFWKADGKATSDLMEVFYEELEGGATKSEAMRAAKLAFLEAAPNAQVHPYYWGNFVVIGDDGPVNKGAGIWIWLVVLGLVVGGGFWFWRRRGG